MANRTCYLGAMGSSAVLARLAVTFLVSDVMTGASAYMSAGVGPLPCNHEWRSWDTDFKLLRVQSVLVGDDGTGSASESTVTAELAAYESSMTDLNTPAKTYTYHDGLHANAFNQLDGFQRGASDGYGYWGKSLTQTSGAPLEGGEKVYDNGAHPPNDSNMYTVLRFEIPTTGTYSVDLFGAQRKETSTCGEHTDYGLFARDKQVVLLENVDKNSVIPTETSGVNVNIVHNLGDFSQGEHIYFTVHNNDGYGCDANYVRWRVTLEESCEVTTESNCEQGMYYDSDTTECAVVSVCPPGGFVETAATSHHDQVCAPCGPGEFSTTDNAPSCSACAVCTATQLLSAACTYTTNRECDDFDQAPLPVFAATSDTGQVGKFGEDTIAVLPPKYPDGGKTFLGGTVHVGDILVVSGKAWSPAAIEDLQAQNDALLEQMKRLAERVAALEASM